MLSKYRSIPRRSLRAAVLLSLLLGAASTPALSWKPSTHVYLALQALNEILSDTDLLGQDKTPGRVVLYRVNYRTGEILDRLGEYEANPALITALEEHRDDFIAGVLGPDAYPDIATGQQRIHVDDPVLTDQWLRYLWEQALQQGPQDNEILAFMAGYLTHAAGDMFMHTFVNNYAGGPFAFGTPDAPDLNAARHVVLESYIGDVTPALDDDAYAYGISDDVLEFVYEHLVDARAGTYLGEQLLTELPLEDAATDASVPRLFSTLRNHLQNLVDEYDAVIEDIDDQIAAIYAVTEDECGGSCTNDTPGPCVAPCLATSLLPEVMALVAQKDGHQLLFGAQTGYARQWIGDIDDGLEQWPAFSHDVAKLLLMNPEGMDLQEARERAEEYKRDHLLSMLGAPDAVGQFESFVEGVKQTLYPDEIREWFTQIEESLIDFMLVTVFKRSAAELREMYVSPQARFNDVLSFPHIGEGNRVGEAITLNRLRNEVLNLQGDDPFDPLAFAPAYNTITMTKLLLMSEQGLLDLRTTLGCSPAACPFLDEAVEDGVRNAMVGFIHSLDADNQWYVAVSGQRMVFGTCTAYAQIFKLQVGDAQDCPNIEPVATPGILPGSGQYTEPVEVTLKSTVPDAALYYTLNLAGNPPIEPEANSPDSRIKRYFGPFTVSPPLADTVEPVYEIRARAFKPGFPPSETAVATVEIDARVDEPAFESEPGDYIEPFAASIQVPAGATVYYTTNGQTPDYNSTVYTGPIALPPGTHALKAVAYRIQFTQSEVVEAAYRVFDANAERVPSPTMKPFSSGQFAESVTVEMHTNTQGGELRYTLAQDAAPPNPTPTSTLYTEPLTLGIGNWFIRVIAFKTGVLPSPVLQRNFNVSEPLGTTSDPVIDPAGGTFTNPVEVTLSAVTDPPTQGVRIFYTTDGADPPVDPQQAGNYQQPFTVNRTGTVKAQATRTFFTDSGISSADFRLECATPEITPGGGAYVDGVTVTLETATENATLRYTLDGTEPTEESTEYTGPFTVENSLTVSARAFKTGYFFSETASATLDITEAAAPTVLSHPEPVTVVVGDTARFYLEATGVPVPSVQWQRDGSGLDGATADSLVLASVSMEQAGAYRAVVTNALGADTTLAALLTVNPTPVAPSILEQPASLVVARGDSAVLRVSAAGTPEPAYLWFRNGQPLVAQNRATLVFNGVQLAQAGEYAVLVRNTAGEVLSQAATLTVDVDAPVSTTTDELPDHYRLDQNYPNPFNPTTTIPFTLPEHTRVTLALYDLMGRQVALLVDKDLPPGTYEAAFDATGLANGTYFYRLQTAAWTRTKKMLLLK